MVDVHLKTIVLSRPTSLQPAASMLIDSQRVSPVLSGLLVTGQ